MKSHFTAFQREAVFVCGADHFTLVYVDHFPKVMALAFVAEILGKLHVEHHNDFFDIEDPVKSKRCKFIFHINTPIADFINIITDFALQCNGVVAIIKKENL